jgi:hypothetical protein
MINRTKYPRTFHIIGSPGASDDDKVLLDMDSFRNKEVVITEKMDGQNCTMYNDYIHARSIDGRHHPSQDWVKQFHSQIKYLIPLGDRICGENLYAQHSIPYTDLLSYFYGFSYWSNELCVDYDTTIDMFNSLQIVSPNVIYRGIYNESIVESIANSFPNEKEGFVIRNTNCFHIQDFQSNVAKWVRVDHVTTSQHWMTSTIIPNKLKDHKYETTTF